MTYQGEPWTRLFLLLLRGGVSDFGNNFELCELDLSLGDDDVGLMLTTPSDGGLPFLFKRPFRSILGKNSFVNELNELAISFVFISLSSSGACSCCPISIPSSFVVSAKLDPVKPLIPPLLHPYLIILPVRLLLRSGINGGPFFCIL